MNRGPQAPKELPLLTVANTMLTTNSTLTGHLKPSRSVRLEFDLSGHPLLIPDRDGHAVVLNVRGYTGFIAAPSMVRKAKEHLPVGSKWYMVWQADKQAWCGTRWEGTQ